MCRNSVKWLYRADESFSWESGLEADSPVNRRQADACFLRLMEESEFMLRYLYWAAVRLFGWLVYGAKKTKRGWQGSGSPVGDLI